MRIIGCDLHARQQTIAMLDTETGEVVEKILRHEAEYVREFYASLPGPVRVGIEATGSMHWFLKLMEELGIDCQVGHPAKIRAAEPRKQKHDRRDAALQLKLLVENRFPAIWIPSSELRDLRALLLHRHQWVRMRTFPIEGTWERYSLRAGNLLFLMMSDINEPTQKIGRGTLGGNPGGVVSGETFRWWKRMVEENPSSIIISAHHYMLKNTTVASGEWEGMRRDEKGQWRDWYHGYYEGKGTPQGASYLYWVDSKQDSGAFENFLGASPGRVDLWLGAHTHRSVRHVWREISYRAPLGHDIYQCCGPDQVHGCTGKLRSAELAADVHRRQ